jgi:hypothetical protein
MGKFNIWLNKQIEKSQSNPIWKLFLSGVKGQF